MRTKTYLPFLFVCIVSFFAGAAHLEYRQGSMEGAAGGYAYNAAESDPYDDPGTYGPDYRVQYGYDPAMLDLSVGCAVSTALTNGALQFTNDVTGGGVHIAMALDADGQTSTADSGVGTYLRIAPDAYYTSSAYGLFYAVVSDGEPAGTPVALRVSWTAEGQVSGLGYADFNNDGLLVAIGSNPFDPYPAAETIVYTGEHSYFSAESAPPKNDSAVFMAAVGDTIALYLDAYAGISCDGQIGSGDIAASFELDLEVLAARTHAADVNRDRKVNLTDLALLAESWLWEAPPPSNINCQAAILVQAGKVYQESTADAENGQLWYRMRPAEDGRYIVSLCGSDFDTRLTVYESSQEGCPGNPVAENDDACGRQSQVTADFYASGGYINIDSPTGQVGNVRMELTRLARPANDESGQATPAGLNTTYTGSTAGSVGDGCVWYTFAPEADDYYVLSLCGSGFDTTLRVYDASWTEAGYNDNRCELASELTLFLYAGTQYTIEVGGYERGDYRLRITEGASVPSNDECASAQPIYMLEGNTGDLTTSTGSDISSCGEGDDHDVWYQFTADYDRTYYFYLSDNYDGKTLTLYDASGCPGAELSCGQTTSGWLEVQYELAAGQQVLLRVGGQTGDFSLSVQ